MKPSDVLDHATSEIANGRKLGIDATKKMPGEGFKRPWPPLIKMDYVVLIELEHPAKPWATSAGQQVADFTQATNQIADWKCGFREPLNVAQFQRSYRIASDWIQSRTFEQRYFLIYVRRSGPSLTEAFSKKRKLLERENEDHMTYDRIAPQREMDCLCAKLDEKGYRAISIPPTLELGA